MSFKFAMFSSRARMVNGKLQAEVFTMETEKPDFSDADVNRIVFNDGAWSQELPEEVKVNKLTEHCGEWSRPAGYEVSYKLPVVVPEAEAKE